MPNNEQAIGLSLQNDAGAMFDVTDLLWPRYQRISAAIGGDLTARSSFAVDGANAASDWLERLGWHFSESYSSVPTWVGRLAKVTVDLYGQVASVSLRDLYNSVIVVYSRNNGQINETPPAIDQASIDRYGFRQLIYDSGIILSNADALLVRDGLLAHLSTPTLNAEQLRASGSGGVGVSLEFDGTIKTLQVQHYEAASGSDMPANAAIELTVAGATEVVLGRIDDNPLMQIETQSDLVDMWSRIREIANFRDELGHFWLLGCFGSNRLDYYEPQTTKPTYYAELDRDNRLVYFDAGGNILPPALLRPGRLIWRRDLLAGRPPAFPIANDIRAMVIGSINFSRSGVQVTGLKLDDNSTLQALITMLDPVVNDI